MGCITAKNRKNTNIEIPPISSTQTHQQKKPQTLTRNDTASTLATFSNGATKSNIFRRSSSMQLKDRITFKEYIKVVSQKRLGSESGSQFLVCGPGVLEDRYELMCQEENIGLYLQIVHGFPFQNIQLIHRSTQPQITSTKTLSPPKNQPHPYPQYHFILAQNITIHLKLLIQCQTCLKITTITQSRTVFNLQNYSNCQCQSQYVRICFLKQQPENLRIWSDQLGCFVFGKGEDQMRVVRCKGKFRVIGCSSCWGFWELRVRDGCGCSVCEKCLGSDCQICRK